MPRTVVYTSTCVFCDEVIRVEIPQPTTNSNVSESLRVAVEKHLDRHVEEMIEVAHGTHN